MSNAVNGLSANVGATRAQATRKSAPSTSTPQKAEPKETYEPGSKEDPKLIKPCVEPKTQAASKLEVGSEVKNLSQKSGEERMQSYHRLMEAAKDPDPAKREEVARAIKQARSEGQDEPHFKLLEAQVAKNKGLVMGPYIGEQPWTEARRLTKEAENQIEKKLSEGKITRQEAALLNYEAAQSYRGVGDEQSARRSEMLFRFSEVDEAERKEVVGSGLTRGSVPRVRVRPGSDVMSAPTQQRRELQDWEKKNNWERFVADGKRELGEDPGKETYPGQPRRDARHQRASGGVGVIEEFNKWVGLKTRMDKASKHIELADEARRSERYPVPPKPEELDRLRRQDELTWGPEKAQQIYEDRLAMSRRFWND